MRVRVSELVQCTRGTLLCGDPDTNVDSFEIDTRRLREGGAFFALKGSRADGHAFLEQAAKAGAAVAVIERDPKQGAATPPALIRVEDSVSEGVQHDEPIGGLHRPPRLFGVRVKKAVQVGSCQR